MSTVRVKKKANGVIYDHIIRKKGRRGVNEEKHDLNQVVIATTR